ncbi:MULTISPECIES: hypothetical protein [Nocardia]|uniref:hypothetical protein n=1 Tax=Nocardia neocaledoniensis TaxID=236511 RepID=UPI0024571819|nr:hypothetical protein [Nocardia neocaledoniensis]
MATSVTETPAHRCAAYRQFGWRVVLDSHDNIVLPADQIHGIQVCDRLADKVADQLQHSRIQTPIVHNTATGQRMFLTTAIRAEDPRLINIFPRGSKVQAIRTAPGSPIPLPTPGDPTRVWLSPPRPGALADFELVYTITRDAARGLLDAA